MTNKAWYPIKVKGGQEEKVKLRIEATLQEKGIEKMVDDILVPFQRVYTVQAGKKIIKKRYFAYIVILADFQKNNKLRELIQQVQGVRGYISAAGWGGTHEPTPLEKEEVDIMLGNEVTVDTLDEDVKKNFKEGEKVEITNGVLKGKLAIIRKLDSNRKKLEATIQIFGKETKTELNFSQVKKL
ncbi:MAG: transcription termination/antitermination protein NusG [Bacteroidota bacterium]